MKKRMLCIFIFGLCLILGFMGWKNYYKTSEKEVEKKMIGTVMYIDHDYFVVKDQKNKQFYFKLKDNYDIKVGDQLKIQYNIHLCCLCRGAVSK